MRRPFVNSDALLGRKEIWLRGVDLNHRPLGYGAQNTISPVRILCQRNRLFKMD